MKKIGAILLVLIGQGIIAQAQDAPVTDTTIGRITVYKDARLAILANKQADKNALGPRSARGYRLMIINTNDRELALKVRSQLLQRYPEQKVYMSFKPPYIQVKFGNFVEKAEAEKYKANIKKSGIVATNIYEIPEIVEVKPPKDGEKDPREAQ